MPEFWEQDQVAQPAAPAAGNFWANDPVAGQQAPEPVPQSPAFAARVAQGTVMGQAFQEMAAKPYSERIKEWSANELKQGGVTGYGAAALGTLAATVAQIPEMVASGVTLGKDVLQGKVITGPGLRKEDFSDDPNAPEPLDTLIRRSQDMAMTGGVTPDVPAKVPLIDAGNGQFARPYTAADGTVRAQVVGKPPTPADFQNAAQAIGGKWVDAFHGSPTKFKAFDDTKGPIYFTPHEDIAHVYANNTAEEGFARLQGREIETPGKQPNVVAAKVRMDNPFVASMWDFENAAKARDPKWLKDNGYDSAILTDPKDPTATEYVIPSKDQIRRAGFDDPDANLRRAWVEDGIHPAEAVHDAQSDAFLKRDLTAPHEEVKLPPDVEEVLTETGGRPASLSAAVTDAPLDVPLSEQPASPAGRLSESLKATGDRLMDIGRDTQMLVAPMARGTVESAAIAKDFANSLRRNRWDWSRIDDDIASGFTAEQRKRMWDAADEESVMRQSGEQSEHMGLATLEPAERAAVEDLQARAQVAWLRARDLGMVEGEGLPAYTPRMVINAATRAEGGIPLNGIGMNLRTRTANMLRRKYLTAEETEAAAKQALGDTAEVARDIRVLPLATARLEDAIAGRTLINAIKDYGKRTGADTVSEGAIPAGTDQKWFTLDHPAFKTWRPKFKEKEGGGAEVVKDAEGNTIFEQVPLYVHGDFEGPLRAVLSHRSGALYGAMMSLKGKTMSLIMNSPLIHNAVEWGRALPAMPGKVATFKVYFEGNRFKNDVAGMHEAIDAGLVPIGHRFFKQDITSIMEAPDLTPGRSWTAKLLGAVPGLFDEAAGTAVKRAIDKAGDFWHNTLLWDRVGDLQAGLYVNFRDELVAKGVDRQTSARVAAHFANRFAGSLPQEAMSDGARKIANMLMFSRTFTMGNLGVMKDMLTGMPKDVLAQIERDAGFPKGGLTNPAPEAEASAAGAQEAVRYAKTLARRKAIAVVATDIAMFYIGNSLLQNAMNVMFNDSTLEKELHDYVGRFQEAMTRTREHPLSLLQPFNFLQSLSATSANEPGRQDRIMIGHAKDGTAIYARNPAGKIGEEFIGYMTGPLDMMRRKLGTVARPVWQIMANDKGFGRKVYDPDADTPAKYVANAAAIAKQFAESQLPAGQISAFSDLVKGEGDPTVNKLQAFGPIGGVTFSKGAPGGPAVGELYHARAQHDFAVQAELPDIQRQYLRGDVSGAMSRMTDLGIPAGLQRYYTRVWANPATRLSGRSIRDFYLYATPEQRTRLEAIRNGPMAPRQ